MLVNTSITNPNSNITIKYHYRSIVVISSGNITRLCVPRCRYKPLKQRSPPATSEQWFAGKLSMKDLYFFSVHYNLINSIVQSFARCNKVERCTKCFKQMKMAIHLVKQFRSVLEILM